MTVCRWKKGKVWDPLQSWQTAPYQKSRTAAKKKKKKHVAWFIWSKTRIKHICTVHWNKWGFTLYQKNQYNSRLAVPRNPCACLNKRSPLVQRLDTDSKVTHYDIKHTFFSTFKSQVARVGFGLKCAVLSTKNHSSEEAYVKGVILRHSPGALKRREICDAISCLNFCTSPCTHLSQT